MKSTCPTQTQLWGTQRELYSTGSHWGFKFGVMQILVFTLAVTQILAVLDTNMQKRNIFYIPLQPKILALQWNIGLNPYFTRSSFVLGTKHEQTGDKLHEIDMPNANPTQMCPT